MPYTPTLHANLGYVDKYYKNLLEALCSAEKRTIKDELEVLIVRGAKELGIDVKKVVDK